jgi:hypothetical protein
MYNQKLNKIKDASTSMGVGLLLQEKGEFSKAKQNMQDGIDKIKSILLKDNPSEKFMIFEYVFSCFYNNYLLFSIVSLKNI